MVTNNVDKNRFELQHDTFTAVADYDAAPGLLTITHVVVPVPLRGQGIASQLAKGVIEFARAHDLKVRPVCSFMVAYFQRHPEAQDLLAA